MSIMSQDEYIAILFLDCGYHTSAQRRDWLRMRYSVSYADELSRDQKSNVISRLKAEKVQLDHGDEEDD
jgi:hypothetical protein